ncbi:MAG: hypothetical protein ACTS7E_04355 [Arsenophonus sp. NC-CH8-MAG3]
MASMLLASVATDNINALSAIVEVTKSFSLNSLKGSVTFHIGKIEKAGRKRKEQIAFLIS